MTLFGGATRVQEIAKLLRNSSEFVRFGTEGSVSLARRSLGEGGFKSTRPDQFIENPRNVQSSVGTLGFEWQIATPRTERSVLQTHAFDAIVRDFVLSAAAAGFLAQQSAQIVRSR